MYARAAWALAATLTVAGCGPGDITAPSEAPPSEAALPGEALPATPLQVVRNQVHAFNERDVERMIALAAPEVVWLAIDGDGVVVEARGREELAASMHDYFASVPDIAAEVEATLTAGDRVAVRERATWTDQQGESHSQTSLGVYEVRDGLIRRVWYYPVQP